MSGYLPVKSLLRFRSVCKSWRSLISSPSFIAAHVNHSTMSNTNSRLLLLRHYCHGKNRLSLHFDNGSFEKRGELKSPSTSDIFEAWCKKHGKTYSSDQEKLFRFKIFPENYEFVTRHNSQSNFPYNVSLNAFSDLTDEEFKSSHCVLYWNPPDDLEKFLASEEEQLY